MSIDPVCSGTQFASPVASGTLDSQSRRKPYLCRMISACGLAAPGARWVTDDDSVPLPPATIRQFDRAQAQSSRLVMMATFARESPPVLSESQSNQTSLARKFAYGRKQGNRGTRAWLFSRAKDATGAVWSWGFNGSFFCDFFISSKYAAFVGLQYRRQISWAFDGLGTIVL